MVWVCITTPSPLKWPLCEGNVILENDENCHFTTQTLSSITPKRFNETTQNQSDHLPYGRTFSLPQKMGSTTLSWANRRLDENRPSGDLMSSPIYNWANPIYNWANVVRVTDYISSWGGGGGKPRADLGSGLTGALQRLGQNSIPPRWPTLQKLRWPPRPRCLRYHHEIWRANCARWVLRGHKIFLKSAQKQKSYEQTHFLGFKTWNEKNGGAISS